MCCLSSLGSRAGNVSQIRPARLVPPGSPVESPIGPQAPRGSCQREPMRWTIRAGGAVVGCFRWGTANGTELERVRESADVTGFGSHGNLLRDPL